MNRGAATQDVATIHDHKIEIYSKRYFDLSPTWFAWIKLSAVDVYSLRRERGFEGQHVFFHLNYPVRYVDLIGIIVSIESVGSGRYTILQLDDSSGLLIEVKIALTLSGHDGVSAPISSVHSNTDVQNLRVNVSMGVVKLVVSDIAVEVGHLLRVKGEMDEFRGIRQILPKRVWVVKNTSEEVEFWRKMEAFKKDVMSSPWILEPGQRKEVDETARKRGLVETKRKRRLERARKEREARECSNLQILGRPAASGDLERKTSREQKRRRLDAGILVAEPTFAHDFDEGALEGSNIIRKPWE